MAVAALALLAGQPATLAAEQSQLEQGRQLFMQKAMPACALCHALKAAGSEGAVGPSLDELKPDAARVAKALRDGIGQMPSYKSTLSEAQILSVAAYVSQAAAGGK